jgi:hypothetical protein
MYFQIKIDSDNAQMQDAPSERVADILEKVAQRLRSGEDEGRVFDVNGNRVGIWILDERERMIRERNKGAL